ncbi:2TM domain-containing protein [Rasiella rasia]|uniref:2TM domain-containing protein n=1 Tax=Rasiella rasia TaxID=2744027 RepID=A0A6G6GHV9_9FLAO|nr:2TM domain-containing protein [Rasiella rasia]QIE58138.1 2TM domain-containing protein [Rasiella rasia]
METLNNNREFRLQQAKEKVEKLKGFYTHFTIYLIFVPIFISINYFGGSNFPWAVFPIIGWGFGVFGHASETFGWNPFFGKNWEERKMKEFMDSDTSINL